MGMKHGCDSEHDYSDHKFSMGHGSPKATHQTHGGKAGVPSELRVGASPHGEREGKGKTNSKRGSDFEGGAATSGKARGMKTYREE